MNLLSDKDRCIGQVLDTLDDLDLWKDTVVVFTSDHGELGGSHGGLRNKGLLNELMAREVGVNDGHFLPPAVRPKGSVCCEAAPTASPK